MRGAINQLWPTTLSALNNINNINTSLLTNSLMTRLKGLRSESYLTNNHFSTNQNQIYLASNEDTIGMSSPSSSKSELNGFNNMLIHRGDWDEFSGYTGYDYITAGTIFGADRKFGAESFGGFEIASFITDIEYEDTGNSSGKVKTISGGAYGTKLYDNWDINTSAFGGYNWYESKRRIAFGAINRTAKADYNGWNIGWHLGAGYDYKVKSLVIRPEAEVDYTYLKTESYTEKGADALNLHVDDTSTDYLSTTIGLSIDYPFETTSGVTIVSSALAKWRHEYLGNDEDVSAYLAGAPSDTFYINTAEQDTDSVLLGFSMTRKEKHISYKGSYLANLSGDFNTHEVSFEFQYNF